MKFNETVFNRIVSEAKAKTTDGAWLRAIDKAAAGILTDSVCVTLLADDTALVTTTNGSYRVNGVCPCAARTPHCYHRAAKRLWALYEAAVLAAPATRESLIADIKARTNPIELSAWLQRRFGVTLITSRFLHIESLRQIHQAVAA